MEQSGLIVLLQGNIHIGSVRRGFAKRIETTSDNKDDCMTSNNTTPACSRTNKHPSVAVYMNWPKQP